MSAGRYFNTTTREYSEYPPEEFKGGILANSMGLGKSLSIISLFATGWVDGGETAKNGARQPTLLIIPSPLLEQWGRELSLHLHLATLTWC